MTNPLCRNTCVTCWAKRKRVFLCLQKRGWVADERRVLPGPSTATLATLWKSQRAQKLDLISVRRMKLWNEIGHPVCTVEMWWLRTTLAIFRGAVWAETCCCAPKVRCFQSRVRSASSPCLSQGNPFSVFSAADFCNYRSPLRPMQGSLLSSHGWFTLLISRSHRSWPWGRTAVVTTTSWPTLWVVIRRLPGGGQDLSYSACALTLTCMHSIWVPGFCV